MEVAGKARNRHRRARNAVCDCEGTFPSLPLRTAQDSDLLVLFSRRKIEWDLFWGLIMERIVFIDVKRSLFVCVCPQVRLPPARRTRTGRSAGEATCHGRTRCPTRDESSIAAGPRGYRDDDDDASVATHRAKATAVHSTRPRGDGKQTCGMGTTRRRSEISGPFAARILGS